MVLLPLLIGLVSELCNPFGSVPPKEKKQSELWELVNRDKKQSDKVYLSEESKYYLMISKSIDSHSSDVLHQLRRSFVRPCPQGVCHQMNACYFKVIFRER